MSTGTGISNYAELKILDHMLGTTTWTKPTAVYMALGTDTTPSDTTFTELTVDTYGYARQAVAFDAAASGAANNTAIITFGPCSGTTWGTVKSFALYDNDGSPSGNMICYGSLSSPVTIDVADRLEFAAGAVVVNLD